MFLHDMHLRGRSGISRLMFTTLIVLILSALGLSTLAQEDGGTLRVGMVPPVEVDPALGTNDPEILINRTIYDYLVEVTPQNTIAPNLASDWTISEDGLTYTFNLVEGVTFHDGSAFTAEDVVFTYERLQELGSPAIGLLGDFTVAALDDSTVEFTLGTASADFIFGVASRHAVVLNAGTETINDANDLATWNGTGPFVLTEFDGSDSATFVANENYWQEGAVQLAGLEFVFIEDALTQINALRDGELDFIFKIDVDQIPNVEDIEGVSLLETASNLHPLVRIRADEGALGEDVRIRQAFKLATDREELLETVQNDYGVVGNNNPIGPSYGAFYDGSIEEPAYDPEAACELIQEATGEERLSSDFYVVDAFNYESLGVALRDQWAEGCIDVNILVRSEGVYYADDEWLTVDLGITGWGDRAVPQQYLNEAFLPDAPFNETHWADDELVTLVEQASATPDPEARAAIYTEIAQVFADRGPVIIPWFASVFGAVGDNVEGLVLHPFAGQTDFRNVSISE